MQLPLYIVDAFCDAPFSGNPAAVCPLDHWLPDPLLQAIAAQHNLSETAFVVAEGSAFRIRWFTPSIEVALCGHATLASAWVLHHELGQRAPLSFLSRSGPLSVALEGEQLVLDFPAQPLAPAPLNPTLSSALGAAPEAVLAGEDLVAIFPHQRDIEQLTPDFERLRQLPYRGIIATAPGNDCDFVCRFFAPAAGINEDPVTGSAYTKLAPYWQARLTRHTLSARQLSTRGGALTCTPSGDRVLIAGRARLYARGHILLPEGCL